MPCSPVPDRPWARWRTCRRSRRAARSSTCAPTCFPSACVLYEMATGTVAVPGQHGGADIRRHLARMQPQRAVAIAAGPAGGVRADHPEGAREESRSAVSVRRRDARGLKAPAPRCGFEPAFRAGASAMDSRAGSHRRGSRPCRPPVPVDRPPSGSTSVTQRTPQTTPRRNHFERRIPGGRSSAAIGAPSGWCWRA